ncbi:LysR family transcriptional regulator [Bosea sp. (in: a-proteobacteria)]|jgi:DNA-binding transcriptional LysR family regulator|uniref:LysR family transcriptional regulator n=1 Tax=Bosea sp. (in: a-proteobacteria) TaxID=1871050 RepID=UPI002DDD81EE|nr:LysR substrate-binding domain-containing protein [Bosea sp. (in: a-proteobacteria)]HEV2508797.1 LysR substrate-binding domain-containing protein [Bosea sp. (in: a-proteobacteria)]
MKLDHFEEVVAIAERGSMRAAARHLQIAQPALTRSLALLERELGAPLFERRARGVVATPLGEAFVARARSILTEIRRTREEVEQLRGAGTGTVTVGLSIAAHLALLPPSLRPFRARYPDIRLHIIEGFYPTLEERLRDGSVDFYIGPDGGAQPVPQLSREVLFHNRRIVLCRAGHPLAAATSLRELVGQDWVTTSITADASDEINAFFARHGLPPPRLAVRSQSALTLLTCLANSDLLAMVPAQWERFEMTGKALITIRVEEELTAPPLVLVRRSDLPLTPAALHLLDLMRRATSRLTAEP